MTDITGSAYLLWATLAVAATWAVPQRWLVSALITTCGIPLAIYSPWSLLALALLTGLLGYCVIVERSKSGFVLASMGLCVLSLFIYRAALDLGPTPNTLILIGFAFYILRAIHLLVEVYAERLGRITWSELFSWLFFFPTLLVGPIHRFEPFQRNLVRRRWDSNLFAEGMKRATFGYAKVVIIADYLIAQKIGPRIENIDSSSIAFHYLDSLRYGADLYFRFAGYSDVAIGLALMIGFRISENFNAPYLASSITDFWKRWHITLSQWCRDYVYLPVFSHVRIPAIAALASMLALGLWHELSVRYVLWGLWHGAGVAVCQKWQRSRYAKRLNSGKVAPAWRMASILLTLNFVILSFTITGTNSLNDLINRWQILLGFL